MLPKSQLHMLMYMKRIEQKEVAEIIGVTTATICRWMKNPKPEQTEKIMDAIRKIEGSEKQDDEIN